MMDKLLPTMILADSSLPGFLKFLRPLGDQLQRSPNISPRTGQSKITRPLQGLEPARVAQRSKSPENRVRTPDAQKRSPRAELRTRSTGSRRPVRAASPPLPHGAAPSEAPPAAEPVPA